MPRNATARAVSAPVEIPMLSPEDLSRRWRGEISEKTLQNWRHAGKGPKVTYIGDKPMYAIADVVAFERSRRGRR